MPRGTHRGRPRGPRSGGQGFFWFLLAVGAGLGLLFAAVLQRIGS